MLVESSLESSVFQDSAPSLAVFETLFFWKVVVAGKHEAKRCGMPWVTRLKLMVPPPFRSLVCEEELVGTCQPWWFFDARAVRYPNHCRFQGFWVLFLEGLVSAFWKDGSAVALVPVMLRGIYLHSVSHGLSNLVHNLLSSYP